MLMQRIATSFKNRRKNSSEPEPPTLPPHEADTGVYSDEEWSDNEFDPVEYELYADPNTTPPSRFNAAPPLPPPMSPTLQNKRTRPLPPTPTTQVLQDDNGEGLYMGPADAYRGRMDHTPPRPPNHHNGIIPMSNAPQIPGHNQVLQDDNGEGLYMGPGDAYRGRVDHTPPRPPNHHNGIMPKSNAPQTVGLVEDQGIYMGPGDAKPHIRGANSAPPLPPSRPAPRLDEDGQGTTENDSISDIFKFLDAETCSSIVSAAAAEDERDDHYEKIDAVEGFRNNKSSPGSPPPPAGFKPPISPKPQGGFHNFPVAKPRAPPPTPPKPSFVAPGMYQGRGVENQGVRAAGGYKPTGQDVTDTVRARILAGAKRLPTLNVSQMPKLKSPEMGRRNMSPSIGPQVDLRKPTPPPPPPQAMKPPWAIKRQAKTPPVTPNVAPPPPWIVPQTSSGHLDDLYGYHWYHGTLDRAHVNERLYSVNLNGAYLVRKSSRGGETMPYALSILYNDKVWNLHIRLRHDNTYALGTAKQGEMSFHSIPQLVEYHKTTVLILSGSFGGETTLAECPRRLQQFNT